jgi:23S rRNA (guanosine2251-2'-O)-methyltransferase
MRKPNNDNKSYRNRQTSGNDRQPQRPQRPDRHNMSEEFFVCGIHPVEEAFDTIPAETLAKSRIYIAETRQPKALEKILGACESLHITPIEVQMNDLTRRTGETRHQGVLLELPEFRYAEVDDILEHLSPQPLILVLDQIQDPHNLGAIIRSAAAFGVDGIIIPRDRAAQITATAIKTSAGQAYRMPVCRVSNIAQTLRELKDQDFNIVGADIDGDKVEDVNFHRATVLIMGSEGQGMRRLTRTLCDQTVRIAQNPNVESLNVSVATAILLYTASHSRDLPW